MLYCTKFIIEHSESFPITRGTNKDLLRRPGELGEWRPQHSRPYVGQVAANPEYLGDYN